MKRFISSLLAVAMVVVVLGAGCTSAVTPSPAPTSAPSATAPPVATAKPSGTLPPATTAAPTKAAWETKWDQTVAAAKGEGKVVLYGQIGQVLMDRINRDFTSKYGVQAEYVAGTPPEVSQKYLTERTAGLNLADVFITGQTTTITLLKPKGVLGKIKPLLILPEVLDEKAYVDGKLPFLDKDESTLALIASYRSFVVSNTDMVKEGQLTSYQDLLDPKWKGKITLSDPTIPGSAGTMIAFILLKQMGMEAGQAFMQKLAAQDLAITRDTRLHVETVARGKYAIALGALPQVVAELSAAGAPLTWNRMNEGGIMITGSFAAAVPDKPAHPNATTLMINFLLSKQGGLDLSEAAGESSRRVDVAKTFVLPGTTPAPGQKIVWLDEEMITKEPTFYAVSKKIFGIQ